MQFGETADLEIYAASGATRWLHSTENSEEPKKFPAVPVLPVKSAGSRTIQLHCHGRHGYGQHGAMNFADGLSPIA
jgi:hypothetical protein